MLTRKEFDEALDVYEERGDWDPYDTSCSDLAGASTRNFLWGLLTEGFSAVNELPPKTEPIDWSKEPRPPLPLNASRYAVMNREVQEYKERRGDGNV